MFTPRKANDVTSKPARAGDIFLCRQGNSHSLRNTGAGKRVIGASIAKRG